MALSKETLDAIAKVKEKKNGITQQAVNTNSTPAQQVEEKNDFFDVLGSLEKTTKKAIMKPLVEAPVDLIATLLAKGAELIGWQSAQDNLEAFIKTDISDKMAGFATKANAPIHLLTKSNLNAKLPDVVENTANTFGNVVGFAAGSMTGANIGSAGSALSKVGSLGSTFASSMGMGAEEALNQGASLNQALGYGALSGTIETASELVVGKVLNVVGLGANKLHGLVNLGGTANKVTNKVVKSGVTEGLKRIAKNFGEEGLEEVLSDVVNPLLQMATYSKDKTYAEIFEENGGVEGLVESFIYGGLGGGMFETVNVGSNLAKYGNKGSAIIYNLEQIADLNSQEEQAVLSGDVDKINEITNTRNKLISNIEQEFKDYLDSLAKKKDTLKSFENLEGKDLVDNLKKSKITKKDIRQLTAYNAYNDIKQFNSKDSALKTLSDKIGAEIKKDSGKTRYENGTIYLNDKDYNNLTTELNSQVQKKLLHEITHSKSNQKNNLVNLLISKVENYDSKFAEYSKRYNTRMLQDKEVLDYAKEHNVTPNKALNELEKENGFKTNYINEEIASDEMSNVFSSSKDLIDSLENLDKKALDKFIQNIKSVFGNKTKKAVLKELQRISDEKQDKVRYNEEDQYKHAIENAPKKIDISLGSNITLKNSDNSDFEFNVSKKPYLYARGVDLLNKINENDEENIKYFFDSENNEEKYAVVTYGELDGNVFKNEEIDKDSFLPIQKIKCIICDTGYSFELFGDFVIYLDSIGEWFVDYKDSPNLDLTAVDIVAYYDDKGNLIKTNNKEKTLFDILIDPLYVKDKFDFTTDLAKYSVLYYDYKELPETDSRRSEENDKKLISISEKISKLDKNDEEGRKILKKELRELYKELFPREKNNKEIETKPSEETPQDKKDNENIEDSTVKFIVDFIYSGAREIDIKGFDGVVEKDEIAKNISQLYVDKLNGEEFSLEKYNKIIEQIQSSDINQETKNSILEKLDVIFKVGKNPDAVVNYFNQKTKDIISEIEHILNNSEDIFYSLRLNDIVENSLADYKRHSHPLSEFISNELIEFSSVSDEDIKYFKKVFGSAFNEVEKTFKKLQNIKTIFAQSEYTIEDFEKVIKAIENNFRNLDTLSNEIKSFNDAYDIEALAKEKNKTKKQIDKNKLSVFRKAIENSKFKKYFEPILSDLENKDVDKEELEQAIKFVSNPREFFIKINGVFRLSGLSRKYKASILPVYNFISNKKIYDLSKFINKFYNFLQNEGYKLQKNVFGNDLISVEESLTDYPYNVFNVERVEFKGINNIETLINDEKRELNDIKIDLYTEIEKVDKLLKYDYLKLSDFYLLYDYGKYLSHILHNYIYFSRSEFFPEYIVEFIEAFGSEHTNIYTEHRDNVLEKNIINVKKELENKENRLYNQLSGLRESALNWINMGNYTAKFDKIELYNMNSYFSEIDNVFKVLGITNKEIKSDIKIMKNIVNEIGKRGKNSVDQTLSYINLALQKLNNIVNEMHDLVTKETEKINEFKTDFRQIEFKKASEEFEKYLYNSNDKPKEIEDTVKTTKEEIEDNIEMDELGEKKKWLAKLYPGIEKFFKSDNFIKYVQNTSFSISKEEDAYIYKPIRASRSNGFFGLSEASEFLDVSDNGSIVKNSTKVTKDNYQKLNYISGNIQSDTMLYDFVFKKLSNGEYKKENRAFVSNKVNELLNTEEERKKYEIEFFNSLDWLQRILHKVGVTLHDEYLKVYKDELEKKKKAAKVGRPKKQEDAPTKTPLVEGTELIDYSSPDFIESLFNGDISAIDEAISKATEETDDKTEIVDNEKNKDIPTFGKAKRNAIYNLTPKEIKEIEFPYKVSTDYKYQVFEKEFDKLKDVELYDTTKKVVENITPSLQLAYLTTIKEFSDPVFSNILEDMFDNKFVSQRGMLNRIHKYSEIRFESNENTIYDALKESYKGQVLAEYAHNYIDEYIKGGNVTNKELLYRLLTVSNELDMHKTFFEKNVMRLKEIYLFKKFISPNIFVNGKIQEKYPTQYKEAKKFLTNTIKDEMLAKYENELKAKGIKLTTPKIIINEKVSNNAKKTIVNEIDNIYKRQLVSAKEKGYYFTYEDAILFMNVLKELAIQNNLKLRVSNEDALIDSLFKNLNNYRLKEKGILNSITNIFIKHLEFENGAVWNKVSDYKELNDVLISEIRNTLNAVYDERVTNISNDNTKKLTEQIENINSILEVTKTRLENKIQEKALEIQAYKEQEKNLKKEISNLKKELESTDVYYIENKLNDLINRYNNISTSSSVKNKFNAIISSFVGKISSLKKEISLNGRALRVEKSKAFKYIYDGSIENELNEWYKDKSRNSKEVYSVLPDKLFDKFASNFSKGKFDNLIIDLKKSLNDYRIKLTKTDAKIISKIITNYVTTAKKTVVEKSNIRKVEKINRLKKEKAEVSAKLRKQDVAVRKATSETAVYKWNEKITSILREMYDEFSENENVKVNLTRDNLNNIAQLYIDGDFENASNYILSDLLGIEFKKDSEIEITDDIINKFIKNENITASEQEIADYATELGISIDEVNIDDVIRDGNIKYVQDTIEGYLNIAKVRLRELSNTIGYSKMEKAIKTFTHKIANLNEKNLKLKYITRLTKSLNGLKKYHSSKVAYLKNALSYILRVSSKAIKNGEYRLSVLKTLETLLNDEAINESGYSFADDFLNVSNPYILVDDYFFKSKKELVDYIKSLKEKFDNGVAISSEEILEYIKIANLLKKYYMAVPRHINSGVFNNGKEEDIKETSLRALSEIKKVKNNENGFSKFFDILKKAKVNITSILDPRLIFNRLSAYDTNGVMSQLYNNLVKGENVKEEVHLDLLEPLQNYISSEKMHKEFKEKVSLKVDTGYGEEQILATKGELYSVYKLLFRDKAFDHFIGQGFQFDKKEPIVFTSVEQLIIFAEKLDNIFSEEEKWENFDKEVRKFFYKSANYKMSTDKKLYGETNIENPKQYYPIEIIGELLGNFDNREQAKFDGSVFMDFAFNKKAFKTKKGTIKIKSVDLVVHKYADQMSRYTAFADTIRKFELVLSFKTVKNNGSVVTLKDELNDIGIYEYINTLLNDVMGNRLSRKPTIFTKFRTNYTKAKLGLNLKVMATQLASIPAAMKYLSPMDIAVGCKRAYTKGLTLKDYDLPVLGRFRKFNNNIVASETLIDKFDKVTSGLLKPLTRFDYMAINIIWEGCKHKCNGDIDKATELFNKTVNETQPNTSAIQKPAMLRTESDLWKFLFMFKNQPLKNLSNFIESLDIIKYKGVNKETMSNFAWSTTSLIAQGVVYTAISALAKHLLNGDDDEDENFFIDFVNDNIIGTLPILDKIKLELENSKIKFTSYDVSIPLISDVPQLFTDIANGDIGCKRIINAISDFFGVPLNNAVKYTEPFIRNMENETVQRFLLKYKNKRTDNKTFINEQIAKKNDYKGAMYYHIYTSEIVPINRETSNELYRLYKKEILSGKQGSIYVKKTSDVNIGKRLDELISSSNYSLKSDKIKERAIKLLISKEEYIKYSNEILMSVAEALNIKETLGKEGVVSFIDKLKTQTTNKYLILKLCGYKLSEENEEKVTKYINSL